MATLTEILNTLPSNGNGAINAGVLRAAVGSIWAKAVPEGSVAGNIATFTVDPDGVSIVHDSSVSISSIIDDIATKQDKFPVDAVGVLVNDGGGTLEWLDLSQTIDDIVIAVNSVSDGLVALDAEMLTKQDKLPASANGVLVNDGLGGLVWGEGTVGVASASRPTPTYIGQVHFDADIGGAPTWWNGTEWVRHDGSPA